MKNLQQVAEDSLLEEEALHYAVAAQRYQQRQERFQSAGEVVGWRDGQAEVELMDGARILGKFISPRAAKRVSVVRPRGAVTAFLKG